MSKAKEMKTERLLAHIQVFIDMVESQRGDLLVTRMIDVGYPSKARKNYELFKQPFQIP